MTLLAPLMLLGLVGLALPTIVHLIAKHRFPVREFPSIRLLRYERRANVFSWRLVDGKQLLLRLLVLLLLVLAMARLFFPWASHGPAPRNLVVVLDGSGSMQARVKDPLDGSTTTLFALATEQARTLLADVEAPSRCALLLAGAENRWLAPLTTSPAAAVESLATTKASDGTGPGLVTAVLEACQLVQNRREVRSQVVVFTDLAATAFSARSPQDMAALRAIQASMGESVEILFIDLSLQDRDNLAITSASVQNKELIVGSDLHVMSTVRNFSGEEKAVKLRLEVGGRKEKEVREIALPAGGEAHVDLTSRINRSVRTFAQASLQEEDALLQDNSRDVPVVVANARRVLIVHDPSAVKGRGEPGGIAGLGRGRADAEETAEDEESIDGPTILRFVLNPAREMGAVGGTGILTTVVTPEALGRQPLSKYDVVILYNVAGLPEARQDDLYTFLRQGKGLLFIGGPDCDASRFNRSFLAGTKERPALAPAGLGQVHEANPPVGVGRGGRRHPLLAPFTDPAQGDLGAIQFATVRKVRQLAEGSAVIFATEAGDALCLEKRHGSGVALLMPFDLDLEHGNMARTRVFPVFIWRLIDYMTGRTTLRAPDLLTAEQEGVLTVDEPAFALEERLALTAQGADERAAVLPIREGGAVLAPALPAGRYLLHKERTGAAALGYSRYIAVNPDARESVPARLTATDLQATFGPAARLLPVTEAATITPTGAEGWPLFVFLLAVAYALEAWLGWKASVRRERDLRPGDGA